jgi:hypothetical protein
MSHTKLRKETNCLNCDATVDGPFCKNCGQENIEPKQTLWHLVMHFLEDITHFDSKFLTTLKLLLLKPGFLSSEYIKGRRKKYLDPIRMYLFISAAFFILFFSFSSHKKYITAKSDPLTVHRIDSMRSGKDTSHFRGLTTTTIRDKQYTILLLGEKYKYGIDHYDSVTAYEKNKPSMIERYFDHRLVDVWQVYDSDPYNFFDKVIERFKHSLSKIFFISLPIFAFFLYILYIRRRTEYNYVSHAIFSLHYYSVAFFFLVFFVLLGEDWVNETFSDVGEAIIVVGMLTYLYIAMKRFYKQGWFKTLVKFLLLSVSMVLVVSMITAGLFINSFFSMAV